MNCDNLRSAKIILQSSREDVSETSRKDEFFREDLIVPVKLRKTQLSSIISLGNCDHNCLTNTLKLNIYDVKYSQVIYVIYSFC